MNDQRVAPPPLPAGRGYDAPPPHPPAPHPPAPPEPKRRREVAVEDDLIGTWFPRIGVVALVLGAGFGYKLAVDRGIVTPLGRVALGLAAGVALLVIGEWTRRRSWSRYAQAVTAGGIGLLTLVAWAAYRAYGLLDAPEAFAMLAAITVVGALLAIVHDSEALAVLATITGFIVPVVIGEEASRTALSGYTLVLDVGVVSLAAFRRWRSLPWLASAGSWVLFALVVDNVSVGTSIAYATQIFALFATVPFVAALFQGDRASESDIALAFVNSIVYYTTVMGLLDQGHVSAKAPFTAALGIIFAALAFASYRSGNRSLAIAEACIGFGLVTVAVPMGLQGVAVGFVWTIEAAVLLAGGYAYHSSAIRGAGAALLGLALAYTLGFSFSFGSEYRPERLLFSLSSLTLVAQVITLYIAAFTMESSAERDVRNLAWIGASVLTLAWLSWEARARLLPELGSVDARHALSFWYSAIWGTYASILLAVGIVRRLHGARTLALVIFAVTLWKMAANDLWLLPTGLRTIAFIGLGVLLLGCSLLYHRFKDAINGTAHERTNSPGTTENAPV